MQVQNSLTHCSSPTAVENMGCMKATFLLFVLSFTSNALLSPRCLLPFRKVWTWYIRWSLLFGITQKRLYLYKKYITDNILVFNFFSTIVNLMLHDKRSLNAQQCFKTLLFWILRKQSSLRRLLWDYVIQQVNLACPAPSSVDKCFFDLFSQMSFFEEVNSIYATRCYKTDQHFFNLK